MRRTEIAGLQSGFYRSLHAAAMKIRAFSNQIRRLGVVQTELATAVEEHRDVDRRSGRKGQAVEDGRIGQTERPGSGIGQANNAKLLGLAVRLRRSCVADVAGIIKIRKHKPIVEVRCVLALHQQLGVLVEAHVEVVEIFRARRLGHDVDFIIDACLEGSVVEPVNEDF